MNLTLSAFWLVRLVLDPSVFRLVLLGIALAAVGIAAAGLVIDSRRRRVLVVVYRAQQNGGSAG